MIDRSWLTAAELEVLGGALDQYIGYWRRVGEDTHDENMRKIAGWVVFVATQLRQQLNTP